MSLLNYTSSVDADKTAQEIARCLSLHGAQAVLTEYNEVDSYVEAISFRVKLGEQVVSFRLPCDWKPVFEVMYGNKKGYSNYDKRYARQQSEWRAQSVRTAWRIVKDWVEAQMALVETKMATTQQVFLPYAIMPNGQTLSEHITSNPQLLLGSGK